EPSPRDAVTEARVDPVNHKCFDRCRFLEGEITPRDDGEPSLAATPPMIAATPTLIAATATTFRAQLGLNARHAWSARAWSAPVCHTRGQHTRRQHPRSQHTRGRARVLSTRVVSTRALPPGPRSGPGRRGLSPVARSERGGRARARRRGPRSMMFHL